MWGYTAYSIVCEPGAGDVFRGIIRLGSIVRDRYCINCINNEIMVITVIANETILYMTNALYYKMHYINCDK